MPIFHCTHFDGSRTSATTVLYVARQYASVFHGAWTSIPRLLPSRRSGDPIAGSPLSLWAAAKNLSHNASLKSPDKSASSNPGIKNPGRLGRHRLTFGTSPSCRRHQLIHIKHCKRGGCQTGSILDGEGCDVGIAESLIADAPWLGALDLCRCLGGIPSVHAHGTRPGRHPVPHFAGVSPYASVRSPSWAS